MSWRQAAPPPLALFASAVALMRSIQFALDRKNLMHPGKIFVL